MTRAHPRRLPCTVAALLLLPLLAGCESQPAGPSDVRLSAESASPYAMLSVDGLRPDAVRTPITVGGTETTLLYDPVAGTHRFLVPPGETGSVRVRIPGSATGRGEAVLRLQLNPAALTGGTPEAEIARMSATLDRLRANVRSALDSLGASASPSLLALGANLEESALLFAETDPRMTPADREVLAGIFAANRPLYDLVADYLGPARQAARAVADTRPPPRNVAGQVAGLPTAESIAQRCIQANTNLDFANELLNAAGYYHLALPTITTLALRNPAITARVALFTNAFVAGLHSAILVQARQPRFFDPDGLRLEASRIRVRENGGTGELRAYLTLVGAKEAADRGEASYGKSIADFRKHYRNLNDFRRLTDWELLRNLLKGYGISKAVQLLDDAIRLLDEIYQDADDDAGTREVAIAMDGLEVMDVNDTRLWVFTSPATGPSRQFRTVREVRRDLGLEIVALYATAGRGENCTARTHDGDPYEGRNGFLVTGPPILRAVSYSLASVGTCQTSVGVGSLFDIRVSYFAANTMGPGARVNATWSFSPSGNAGSYSVTSNNPSLGVQGDFVFGFCARYNDDESATLTFTATDPEGLRSDARTISIPQPGGVPQLRAGGRSGGAAAGPPAGLASRG